MQRTFGQFTARWRDLNLTPRRQYLTRKLILAGERCVLMALLEIHNGEDLDRVLEDFARLQPEIYRALGADRLPIDELAVIKGGRG